MSDGRPVGVELIEIGSTLGSEETQQQVVQRARSVRFIARIGVAVSLFYVAVYMHRGYGLLAGYDVLFAAIYGGLSLVKEDRAVRAAGIALMCSAALHIGGMGVLYLPPASGSHFYLILIPIFSLIVIHPDDRGWWYGLTLFSLVVITGLEWRRDDFVPLFGQGLAAYDHSLWRAVAACLTVALSFGVFRTFHQELHLARRDLHDSYERSESLLRNMLPESIAQRLKQERHTIADDFEDASVLFADLVGFTSLANRQGANQTVRMLNPIFSAFDQAVRARRLEKIKTIGDAYMVAAGLPTPRADHASQLLGLGLELFEIVRQHNETAGTDLRLRIGVCSGPLIAGVIGSHKLSYDIWGDTVNVASRMESTGIPGRIQVTEAVVEAAKGAFEFEERGLIEVKGRGEMRTFLLST